MSIHPSAIVDSSADIGDEVEIGPFSVIEAGVSIGEGCAIGPHCVVGAGTAMGAGNRCYSGAQIGVTPQDLKHEHGVHGQTVIGDGNTFREFVTVSSSTVYSSEDEGKATRVDDGCLFMACSHVAHDCAVGSGVIMANSAALAGHVSVQDRAILGGLVGIHQFCVIGAMAFVGGMSRINKDVPPYMLVEGNPARCRGPNVLGLERNGFSKETIKSIRDIYRLLYRSGLNTSQALEQIDESVADCGARRVLTEFVRASQRGITK